MLLYFLNPEYAEYFLVNGESYNLTKSKSRNNLLS